MLAVRKGKAGVGRILNTAKDNLETSQRSLSVTTISDGKVDGGVCKPEAWGRYERKPFKTDTADTVVQQPSARTCCNLRYLQHWETKRVLLRHSRHCWTNFIQWDRWHGSLLSKDSKVHFYLCILCEVYDSLYFLKDKGLNLFWCDTYISDQMELFRM